jgi:hypothetical protein
MQPGHLKKRSVAFRHMAHTKVGLTIRYAITTCRVHISDSSLAEQLYFGTKKQNKSASYSFLYPITSLPFDK